jgi:hypothetical protein
MSRCSRPTIPDYQEFLANSTISSGYDELGRLNSRQINGVAQTLLRDALGRIGSKIGVSNCLRSQG